MRDRLRRRSQCRAQRTLVALVPAAIVVAIGSRLSAAPGAPGPLTRSHTQIQCDACHVAGSNELSRDKCLACHDHQDLGARVRAGAGLHGSPLVSGQPCAACHSEHKGPSFDLRGWQALPNGEKGFDHRLAGWNLGANHGSIECVDCHAATDKQGLRVYRDLFHLVDASGHVDCVGCHSHKHVHNGRYASDQCLSCHLAKLRIAPNAFVMRAHGASGSFPLVKGHKSIPCVDCHTTRATSGATLFSTLETNCGANSCHQDPLHVGTLGQGCATCHRSGTWDASSFDHQSPFPVDATGEVPSFPLRGMHATLACTACHAKREFASTHASCAAAGCHLTDDAHKGRLGRKCDRCHLDTGDNVFNHNRMSAFRLDGKHIAVPCGDCHASITFKPRPLTCFGCHPEPAIHEDQFGVACENCHTTSTFEKLPRDPRS